MPSEAKRMRVAKRDDAAIDRIRRQEIKCPICMDPILFRPVACHDSTHYPCLSPLRINGHSKDCDSCEHCRRSVELLNARLRESVARMEHGK